MAQTSVDARSRMKRQYQLANSNHASVAAESKRDEFSTRSYTQIAFPSTLPLTITQAQLCIVHALRLLHMNNNTVGDSIDQLRTILSPYSEEHSFISFLQSIEDVLLSSAAAQYKMLSQISRSASSTSINLELITSLYRWFLTDKQKQQNPLSTTTEVSSSYASRTPSRQPAPTSSTPSSAVQSPRRLQKSKIANSSNSIYPPPSSAGICDAAVAVAARPISVKPTRYDHLPGRLLNHFQSQPPHTSSQSDLFASDSRSRIRSTNHERSRSRSASADRRRAIPMTRSDLDDATGRTSRANRRTPAESNALTPRSRQRSTSASGIRSSSAIAPSSGSIKLSEKTPITSIRRRSLSASRSFPQPSFLAASPPPTTSLPFTTPSPPLTEHLTAEVVAQIESMNRNLEILLAAERERSRVRRQEKMKRGTMDGRANEYRTESTSSGMVNTPRGRSSAMNGAIARSRSSTPTSTSSVPRPSSSHRQGSRPIPQARPMSYLTYATNQELLRQTRRYETILAREDEQSWQKGGGEKKYENGNGSSHAAIDLSFHRGPFSSNSTNATTPAPLSPRARDMSYLPYQVNRDHLRASQALDARLKAAAAVAARQNRRSTSTANSAATTPHNRLQSADAASSPALSPNTMHHLRSLRLSSQQLTPSHRQFRENERSHDVHDNQPPSISSSSHHHNSSTFTPSNLHQCRTSSQFSQLRNELRAYGIKRLQDDLIREGWFERRKSDGSVVLTSNDQPFNPFTRLVTGKLSASYGNHLLTHSMSSSSQRFFIAHNRPELDEHWASSDSSWIGKASMGKRHQLLLIRSLDWQTFNCATLGIGGGREELESALHLLDDLESTAHEYTRRAGWSSQLGLYFHAYPFNSVQALHLHMIDLETRGPSFFALEWKNLKLEEVRQVLREELEEVEKERGGQKQQNQYGTTPHHDDPYDNIENGASSPHLSPDEYDDNHLDDAERYYQAMRSQHNGPANKNEQDETSYDPFAAEQETLANLAR